MSRLPANGLNSNKNDKTKAKISDSVSNLWNKSLISLTSADEASNNAK